MTPEYIASRLWVNVLKLAVTLILLGALVYGFSMLVEHPVAAEAVLGFFLMATTLRICVTVWEW